ncbi:cryptochrome/photolyase family protein [Thiomicrorhabdus indica]|uniref:cryptochrome/photolyase family protein n=1 Tax=Thiomicrorhabdus indica TaxID=2267253 RepID=UPI002AA7E0B9|nr:cryptochrome/photolyase family protein [Thiomicrorhabdus indica]
MMPNWKFDFKFDRPVRKLGLILGDQLNQQLVSRLNPSQDAILMLEVLSESRQPSSSWQKTTLFLSAMRHFANDLKPTWSESAMHYVTISHGCPDFEQGLQAFFQSYQMAFPNESLPALECVLAGDDSIKQSIDTFAHSNGVALQWLADEHFISEPGQFQRWLSGRKQPRMEYYYRLLRQQTGYLMQGVEGQQSSKSQPVGGQWNYDKDNRKSFGKSGPENVPEVRLFELDEVTGSVVETLVELVDKKVLSLAGEPLKLENLTQKGWFWPVTRAQALLVLEGFVGHRLAQFGDFQDAMWQDQPWLFHSRVSSALNMKLLDPREVIEAAIEAFEKNQAPLNAVEGFVRQILGWREYIRGLYWSYRKDWFQANHLNAQRDLPSFFWTGKTQMNCQSQAVSQVLQTGYGHHIQRLMVTGLFSLLYGVKPQQIHEWYLGLFVDAIAWVEIPNTIGMSQFADGGIVGSKPYIASGAYIQKMSNYCQKCIYNPKLPAGEKACPISTLYWEFIARHQSLLDGHPRLGMQWRNWQNKSDEQQLAIRNRARWLFENIDVV